MHDEKNDNYKKQLHHGQWWRNLAPVVESRPIQQNMVGRRGRDFFHSMSAEGECYTLVSSCAECEMNVSGSSEEGVVP